MTILFEYAGAYSRTYVSGNAGHLPFSDLHLLLRKTGGKYGVV